MSSPARSSLLQSTLSVLETRATPVAQSLERPAADEHDPYYSRYIDRVPSGDLLAYLRHQVDDVVALFGGLTAAQAGFAYAPGKWTVKEVLGHLTDVERVFAFRAVSIGRRDPAPLPNFDQDAWMPPAEFISRPLGDLLAEWVVVRASTILLIEGFPAGASLLRGVAAGKEISVRALLYVPPGHVAHHIDILHQRYLGSESWPR